jgi:hypothetical protein
VTSGLRDTNLARVRATEKYLLKCDHIMVATKIQRAITDRSVQSSIYNVLRSHVSSELNDKTTRGLKIAVVCTKIEVRFVLRIRLGLFTYFTKDINVKALRGEFVGPGKRISPSVMNELDRQLSQAKMRGDRKSKKEIKRRYAKSGNLH